jgi:tRNA A-37 threonylcarbamoyl transferase component Bud32
MAQLLNQGAYGCIYYPGFTCKGNASKNKKYVTKLELKDKTSINEIEISNIIKKIKNHTKYFSIIEKHCEIKLNTFKKKTTSSLSECDVVNNNEFIYNDFILSYVKYIHGKDIDNYISSIEIPVIYITKLLNTLNTVLNSIKLLNKNNIIHFDLHSGNIMYNLKTNTPIIIDYGLSINLNNILSNPSNPDFRKLKKATFHYSPKHLNYPPESHLITYLLDNYNESTNWENQILTSNNLNKFIEDMLTHNVILMEYYKYKGIDSNKKLDDYKYHLKEFNEKFINKNYKEIVTHLLGYKFKWDYYMVTVNYILICLNKNKHIETSNEKLSEKITNFLLELLIYNLHPDPYKRLRKLQFKKLLSICFKLTTTKTPENRTQQIEDKIKEENIIFHDYIITPDFSIFKNKEIINFINEIQKDIDFH